MIRNMSGLLPLPKHTDIREEYTYKTSSIIQGEPYWDHTRVDVYREAHGGELIYSYERNYPMALTFEPFRQYRDGEWHDYALISPEYTRFQVLDLESCTIVAKEPFPVFSQSRFDALQAKANGGDLAAARSLKGEYPGKEHPEWGFCPMEFYVPDLNEYYSNNYTYIAQQVEGKSVEDYQMLIGNHGFYLGCVWGDDTSAKLRHIDLSKISEGIVTSDDRFGYFEYDGGRLKDSIRVYNTDNTIVVPRLAMLDVLTGKDLSREDFS